MPGDIETIFSPLAETDSSGLLSILTNPDLFLPLADVLNEGIVVYTSKGDILLYNKAAARITSLSKLQMSDKEYVLHTWKPFREDRTYFEWHNLPAATVLSTNQAQHDILVGYDDAGKNTCWIKTSVWPVWDKAGKEILLIICTFTDHTAVYRAEEKIKQSQEELRSVLNNSRNGIFLINSDYRILLANQYARKILQLFDQDFIENEQVSFLDKLNPLRRDFVRTVLEKVFTGEPVEYETAFTKNDGKELWLIVNYAPIRDSTGKVGSACITLTNVTALKLKDTDLRKSEQRWKFALAGAGDGVWEYNFETRESYYSPLYKAMLGFSEEEFSNESIEWRERVSPDDIHKVNEIDQQYETGLIDHHAIEYRLRNKEGVYIWILDRGMIMEKKEDGKPLKLIGTHTNIDGRKKSEESLRQSEQRFSSFMGNTPTMNWIIDENAVFRYLNEPYMKSFNLTPDAVGRSVYTIFPKEICDVFVENNNTVWRLNKGIEVTEEGVGPDGEKQWYHIFKFPLAEENGVKMLGGVALDITKRVLLEKQLAAEEARSRRETIHAIIDAQEKERKEIAYELHDNVNQILSSSKLMLEVTHDKPALTKEFVQKSLNYLNEAIMEIRKISHSLTPRTLRDISMEAAIEELVQNINSTGKLIVDYDKQERIQLEKIQSDIQLTILRITQEQLNNILKHARATRAGVLLLINQKRIALQIHDNGQGFDPEITKKGLGLNNIFNRVEYYQGTVRLETAPGKGCSLSIEIPLQE